MRKAPLFLSSSTALRYIAALGFLFLLLFLRRPDSLTKPQFFAEDGLVFFHDQVLFGAWDALFTPYAGYLHVVPRLVAFIASFFPVREAPLVYNFLALAIADACCGLFSLPAFRFVVRSDMLRFAVCVVVAAGIDSTELVGTITNIQWYLQLAAILILLYSFTREAAGGWLWHTALSLLMLSLALSVPMLIIAVPLALWSLVRSKPASRWISAALILGAGIQTVIYLGSGSTRGHSALADFGGLFESSAVYLVFRGVLSSVIGRPEAMILCARGTAIPTLIVWSAGLLWLVWLWRRTATPTRSAIAVALYLAISSAVLCIVARDLPRGSQPITFGGERYFYLSACCGVVALAITLESIPWKRLARLRPVALLLVFSAGIYMNFRVPAYVPMQWNEHAVQVEQWLRDFRSGALLRPLAIPINPIQMNSAWSIVLDGSILTNGAFEEAYALPWMPLGGVRAELSGAPPSQRHEAPSTGRALLKLEYTGSGERIYWNEVRLGRLVDRLVASWGGIQTVPGGLEISSAAAWATLTPDDGMAVLAASPNTSLRPRYGALSVHGRPFTLLQLGIPAKSAPGIVQVAVFRPGCAGSLAVQPAPDVLIECAGMAGAPEGQVLMADWTGNGTVRLGVFRDGVWYLDLNGNRRWDGASGGDGVYRFGLPGDIAVTGDWNGDGSSKFGVYRCPAQGICEWLLDRNGNKAWDPGDPVYSYGLPGDIPVVSKWNPRDTSDHIGVYRNGTWIVDSNGDGMYQPTDATYRFGLPGDIPVVSHSRGRIGVFRRGTWILDTNGSGTWEPSDAMVRAGRSTDRPLLGEW
jgi:hypothetical protein